MIPTDAELRYDANEQWSDCGAREGDFRSYFVERMADQINAAYKAGEIDLERLRTAFDAVLTPIPYRRRFARKERMTAVDAHRFLNSIGIEVSGVMLAAVAADYGIKVIDLHDGPDLDTADLDVDDDPNNDWAP